MGGGRRPGVGRASVEVGVGQASAGRASEHWRPHSGRASEHLSVGAGVGRASAGRSEHRRPHSGRASTGRATPCDNRAEGGVGWSGLIGMH
jgi:hypothetical protein